MASTMWIRWLHMLNAKLLYAAMRPWPVLPRTKSIGTTDEHRWTHISSLSVFICGSILLSRRRQEIDFMQPGEPHYLRRIRHVVDRGEQIPQPARGRHPEQAGDVRGAVVEQPMRYTAREADQIAGRGIRRLTVQHQVEATLEDVDELILGGMDVWRHKGSGG